MRAVVAALIVVCALLVGAEFFVHKHGHFAWEEFPLFYALFGFAAFTIAVYAGKLLRALFGRDEDYYDR